MSEIEPGGFEHRFGGLYRLYGKEAVDRLQNVTVSIVGVGGVGSWVGEALARSGVGHIQLIDWDDICFSNVNRQIHAMNGTAGQAKVDVLAERITLINPECNVTSIREFYTPKNAEAIITTELDYVVDAIDRFSAKVHLITRCRRIGVPVVVSGGAGGRVDPTQIQSCDLRDSHNDPLLSKVRKRLRKEFNLTGRPKAKFKVPCVFSAEPIRYPHPDGSICLQKVSGDHSRQLDCNHGFGSVSFLTGAFGFAMAAKIINDLCDTSRNL